MTYFKFGICYLLELENSESAVGLVISAKNKIKKLINLTTMIYWMITLMKRKLDFHSKY